MLFCWIKIKSHKIITKQGGVSVSPHSKLTLSVKILDTNARDFDQGGHLYNFKALTKGN